MAKKQQNPDLEAEKAQESGVIENAPQTENKDATTPAPPQGDPGDEHGGDPEVPSPVEARDGETGDEEEDTEASGEELKPSVPDDSLAALAQEERERTLKDAKVEIAQGALQSNVPECVVAAIVHNRAWARGETTAPIYDATHGADAVNCTLDFEAGVLTVRYMPGAVTQKAAQSELETAKKSLAEVQIALHQLGEQWKHVEAQIDQLWQGYRGQVLGPLLKEAVAAYRENRGEEARALMGALIEAQGGKVSEASLDQTARLVGHLQMWEAQAGLNKEEEAPLKVQARSLAARVRALEKDARRQTANYQVPLHAPLEFEIFGL